MTLDYITTLFRSAFFLSKRSISVSQSHLFEQRAMDIIPAKSSQSIFFEKAVCETPDESLARNLSGYLMSKDVEDSLKGFFLRGMERIR